MIIASCSNRLAPLISASYKTLIFNGGGHPARTSDALWLQRKAGGGGKTGILRKSQPIKKGKLQPAFDGVFRGVGASEELDLPHKSHTSLTQGHSETHTHTRLVHSPRVSRNLERPFRMFLPKKAHKMSLEHFQKEQLPSATGTNLQAGPTTGRPVPNRAGGGEREINGQLPFGCAAKAPLGERRTDAPRKSWEKQPGRASQAQGNWAPHLAPIETEFPHGRLAHTSSDI